MKVRCEYCQNIVEEKEKICPFCGSPLPESPPRPQPRTSVRSRRPLLMPLLAALAAVTLLAAYPILSRGNSPRGSGQSISEALAEVNAGTAAGETYVTVVNYYLEAGDIETAYRASWELLLLDVEYGEWCVEQFQTFNRRDLAAKLALAFTARGGSQELLSQLADTPLSELLPDSPLCQAMELVLGRTAGNIVLKDLQSVTGLSIGAGDRLTNAQEIGVAFDEDGAELVTVSVEYSGGNAGSMGLICFQGLRRLTLSSAHVKTSEDFLLPGLRELSLLIRMDGKDLSGFSHLKNLERLQIGGPSLVSLDGLDEMPALTSLTLFDTGLTDLSSLASRSRITELALLDNDQLTSVASLAQAAHLEKLTLSGKTFTDLSPLASLSGLSSLTVERTAIRDTRFLSGLSGLKELSLISNRELEAVPELAGMPGLERLTLDDDGYVTKEDLSGLTGLRALDLELSRNLTFLEPLSRLEELTLHFSHSEVDLTPLKQLINLQRFRVRGASFTQLYGLDALRNLPLVELDLYDLSFYGPITPLLEITTLEELSLAEVSSEGTDYGKFANLTRLRTLNLDGYRDMLDLPPGPDETYWSYEAGPASVFVDQLGLLAGLEELRLAGCGVESIESLSGLTSLQYLDLSDNHISDAAPLAGLDALTYLNLAGNRIGDLSPVEGRQGLTLIR